MVTLLEITDAGEDRIALYVMLRDLVAQRCASSLAARFFEARRLFLPCDMTGKACFVVKEQVSCEIETGEAEDVGPVVKYRNVSFRSPAEWLKSR